MRQTFKICENLWIKSLFLTLLVLFLSPSVAFPGKIGGGPYAFLRLGVGARALGMGGAFVAIADDGTATYWNPAGIGLLSKRELNTMYTALSAGEYYTLSEIETTHHYVSYVHPGLLGGGAGISWISFGIRGIEKTGMDQYGELVRIGEFENKEDAFILSYGRDLFEDLFSFGINLKYLTHQLDVHTGQGYGVDIGVLADVSSIFDKKGRPILGILNNVTLGLVVQSNFEKVWDTGHRDSDSISGDLGLAFDPMVSNNYKWRVAFALSQRKEQPMNSSLGTELQFLKIPRIDMLAVRAGVDDWYIENRYEELNLEKLNYRRKLAAGGGLKLGIFQIDYAAVFERFGVKHRISAALKF